MANLGPQGVPRDDVILVLREAGVDCYPHAANPGKIVFAKDGVIEVQDLPDVVGRSMLGRFSNKFNVPAHKFWNPHPR